MELLLALPVLFITTLLFCVIITVIRSFLGKSTLYSEKRSYTTKDGENDFAISNNLGAKISPGKIGAQSNVKLFYGKQASSGLSFSASYGEIFEGIKQINIDYILLGMILISLIGFCYSLFGGFGVKLISEGKNSGWVIIAMLVLWPASGYLRRKFRS